MGNHAYYLIKGFARHDLLARAIVMQAAGAEIPDELIRTGYWTEKLAYRLARYTRADQYVVRDNLFDFWVSRQLEQESNINKNDKAVVFYGWTHHALWSLKRARRLGMVTILERANAHPLTYTRLLAAEYQKRGLRTPPYHPLILKKQLQEIQTADYLAVTSQWTKQSLLEHGIAERRILLTPLGVDTNHYAPLPPLLNQGRGRGWGELFRVVYVGQICLRKGIPYLLEAWRKLQLKHAELLLVGDLVGEMQTILQHARRQSPTITVQPHTPDAAQFYQQASVAILPTLEDGFGLVVLEAMACGIPVIITEHTGAKDCVRPNRDGFLIPPYNMEAIADTLRYCYEHRAQLRTMGRQARQQAEQFSWTRYQDGLAAQVQRIAG